RTEALQDGRLGPAREILREIQLASVPDTDVQEGVTDEVYGSALEGVGEPRGGDQQKRARPPEPGVDQPVDKVEIQIDEPKVIADAVERPPEPGGATAQPCELAIRRVEDVRDDEEHESD